MNQYVLVSKQKGGITMIRSTLNAPDWGTLNSCWTTSIPDPETAKLDMIRIDYLKDLEKLRKKYAAKLLKATSNASSVTTLFN